MNTSSLFTGDGAGSLRAGHWILWPEVTSDTPLWWRVWGGHGYRWFRRGQQEKPETEPTDKTREGASGRVISERTQTQGQRFLFSKTQK